MRMNVQRLYLEDFAWMLAAALLVLLGGQIVKNVLRKEQVSTKLFVHEDLDFSAEKPMGSLFLKVTIALNIYKTI